MEALKQLYTCLELNGIVYIPSHESEDMMVGPGGIRFLKTDLITRGATERNEFLTVRGWHAASWNGKQFPKRADL